MIMTHTPTGGGSNTTTFDATEGQIINLVSAATANVNAGLVSTAAGGVMVRRAFRTKATIRCKIDVQLHLGFILDLQVMRCCQ